MKWIEVKGKQNDPTTENMQGQYGDLLQAIRFGLMTLHEFALLNPRNILTYDEYIEIIQMIASPEYQPKTFMKNQKERCASVMNDSNASVSCERTIMEKFFLPFYIKNIESTTFSVNEYFWLSKIDCEELYEYRDDRYCHSESVEQMQSKMTISEMADPSRSDEKTILHSQTIDVSESIIITLSKAIMVRPGFIYEIKMEQTPPPNCCTGGFLKSTVEMETSATVLFHRNPANNRGLVNGLGFTRI